MCGDGRSVEAKIDSRLLVFLCVCVCLRLYMQLCVRPARECTVAGMEVFQKSRAFTDPS